ncbi:hypothetical protein ACQPXM_38100 [Kribbella sp. CA-253562]|uniref:hypothetical protein n=1 Tax=Kribbella sp. CA-253562 TaxID=3239942 RepID=UPI003D8C32C9
MAVSPHRALRAVVKLTERRRNPPISLDDFLETLENKYGMYEAVELINEVR